MSQVAATPPVAPPPPPPPTATAAPRRPNRWVREALEVGAIALVLYLLIWSVLQTVRVEGESMIPTLQSHDLLLASKISYHLHDPERGDIVILNPPQPPTAPGTPQAPERDFIKRVIGISDDMLEIDSTQHPAVLRIKPGGKGPWQRVSEPYLGDHWEQAAPCCDSGGHAAVSTPTPLTIPKDMFFVMGDNRNRSSDSRVFGLVQKDRISAKAFIRIWPLSTFGRFGSGPALVPAMLVILPFTRAGRRLREFRQERSRPAAG